MALYAIADLHLSSAFSKPMHIFDEIWRNHPEKIKKNWINSITENDTILIPGDISWAMKLSDAKLDLDFINTLPGKKILLQGNHDYWWSSTSNLNDMYDNMSFLKNNFFQYNNIAICGARGWLSPNDTRFGIHDEKIYLRDVKRLKLSIELAIANGYEHIFVMMHFPPTNDKKEYSKFVEVIESYPVEKVIYGHLHGSDKYFSSYIGVVNNIEYNLVSADFLNFNPLRIL